MEMKLCCDCGETKEYSEYHYLDKSSDILKSYCKECSYKRVQKHIDEDPIAYRAYMQRYIRENLEKFAGNHKSKTHPPQAGVYMIECVLTNDMYIGCSSNLRNRYYKHRRNVGLGKQKPLSKLINEMGWEVFDFKVLELCDKDTIFERETHFIQLYKPNLNVNKTK